MDLPIIVPLTRPVLVGDQTWSSLSIDEPDLDAQIAFSEFETTISDPPASLDAARVNLFWIARLADVPKAVAGKIKDSDLTAVNKAMEQVLGFDTGKGAGDGDAPGNETPAK